MLDKPDGSERPRQAGEMCRQELHKVQLWEVQSPAPGEEQPHTPVHAAGQLAGKQLGRKRPRGLGRHKVKACASNVPLQQRQPAAPWGALGRALPAGQAKRLFPFTQPRWDTTSGVAGPVLYFSVQERHGDTRLSPAKGHEDDERTGVSVIWGEAERAETV